MISENLRSSLVLLIACSLLLSACAATSIDDESSSKQTSARRRFAYAHMFTVDGRPMTLWVKLGSRPVGKCGILLNLKCRELANHCHSSMNPGLLNKRSLQTNRTEKRLGRYLERVYAARRRHRGRGKRTRSFRVSCSTCSTRCWSQ